MTITITNAETRPALEYNLIFVKSFVLTQDQATLVRRVEIVVKPYAIDPVNGDRVFSSAESVVQIDDFDAWVMPVMVGQLGSMQAVGAAYQAAKDGSNTLNILDCMAAFQAGIARICAAHGLFQVQVVG